MSEKVLTHNQWSEHLLHAVAELRQHFEHNQANLELEQQEDFNKLFAGSQRVDEIRQSSPNADQQHDLMNALAAIKGYSEMLLEDLAGTVPALDDALNQLLKIIHSANSTEPEQTSAATPATVSDPGFILAVDDQPENRELVTRYLSRAGHRVVTAASGEEALSTLAEVDVDVVLLDLVMPGMDGREVLRRIKEHAEWRATPVIIISGRQDMDGIIGCIESGADDYLFKPFNQVLLAARIKAGIERKRWHDLEADYRLQLERREKFIRATFGRYLTDDIVTEILERPEGLDLGGDLRNVTIMMSDIRGFTTLSENLSPANVVRMLNRYLGRMTDIIMSHHGTIDEFIGDAILAVFGAPKQRQDDADSAVRCALEMQAAMAEINAANSAEGLPEIEMGIALNSGDVIAGNIGSERRSKYGFVGHPMNVTARIEGVTGRGELMISSNTLEQLSGDYQMGESREISVRGLQQNLVIHQVLGDSND